MREFIKLTSCPIILDKANENQTATDAARESKRRADVIIPAKPSCTPMANSRKTETAARALLELYNLEGAREIDCRRGPSDFAARGVEAE